MGDAADDMYDVALSQEATRKWCPKHLHWYSSDVWDEATCDLCESEEEGEVDE